MEQFGFTHFYPFTLDIGLNPKTPQGLEVENALSQMEDSSKVFQIIGNIMVVTSKSKLKKELNEKKEIIDLRLKTIDKQEDKLRAKATELQKEVMKELK